MLDFYNFCRIIFAKIDIFSRKSRISRIPRISRISRRRIFANITNITNIAAANITNIAIFASIAIFANITGIRARYSRPQIPHIRGDFANIAIFATPLVLILYDLEYNLGGSIYFWRSKVGVSIRGVV